VDRLRGVVIESAPAVDVVKRYDSPETLHYVDPPYPHGTRTFKSRPTGRVYRFEMTDDDHRALATGLHAATGAVVLSGYACELYDRELYPDWHRVTKDTHADSALDRTEVLWLNPRCAAAWKEAA
jgi:DNA adenine methylase